MYNYRMTYEDFNGNERSEDFYFNLTEQELMKMNTMVDGGMEQLLNKIIDSQDVKEIVNLFETIIKAAYGEKSPDGRRFVKSEEVWQNFSQTNAYSKLYMELISDPKKASEFIRGIIPKQIATEMDKRTTKLPIEEKVEALTKKQ